MYDIITHTVWSRRAKLGDSLLKLFADGCPRPLQGASLRILPMQARLTSSAFQGSGLSKGEPC